MTLRAYEALIDRVGPCILVGHSQGAGFAAEIARRRPALVRRVVAIEPGGVPSGSAGRALPSHLVVWGDHIAASGQHWTGYRNQATEYLHAIADEAEVNVLDLPAKGIAGNSHIPMMDTNSDEVFALVERWLKREQAQSAATTKKGRIQMKFARFLGMACVIAAGFLPATAGAQAQYPDRPVKLIVPYAPGGTVDAFARVLQPTFEAQLGKPVVIENLAGAGGMIGIRTLIKAKPDGYTIGLGIVSDVVLAPLTEAAAGYTYKELEAVAPLGTSGLGIVAKPGLGIKSIDDLIAYARKNPGKLSNGSTGAGSLPAIAMEDLKRRANIDLQFVPHTSASKIAQGALGGHIDIVASGLPALLEFIKSDRLSGVGVLSTEPDLGNSDLQSAGAVKELAGMDFYFWTGLFAPKGTPPAIVEKLNAAFRAALRDPAIETRFKEFGVRFRQNGHAIEVRTKGEVILCAGSIGST